MAIEPPKRYSTAVYAFTPAYPAGTGSNEPSKDPQAVQAALSDLIQRFRQGIETRAADTNAAFQSSPTLKSSRWFLQIRSLRLAIPGESQSQSSTARTMYMVRTATEPDFLTLVIEDAARAAVNISSLAANAFDYYMSTSLLMPLGNKDSGAAQSSGQSGSNQTSDPREQLHRTQSSRWIPRPSFSQIEGVVLQDPTCDFRISFGMISGRGGTSGSGGIVGSDLIIQLEYLPKPFLDSAISHSVMKDYLAAFVPANGNLREISSEITNLDWKSLLGIAPTEQDMPRWSPRNTSWCLVKLLKEARMA